MIINFVLRFPEREKEKVEKYLLLCGNLKWKYVESKSSYLCVEVATTDEKSYERLQKSVDGCSQAYTINYRRII